MRLRLVLVSLLGALALVAAACGGGEEVQPLPEGAGTVTDTAGGGETTTEGETETEAETETEGGGDGGEVPGDPAAGEQVFASAGCGACHALEAAGSSGQVGPNLDDAQPEYDLIVDRVTNGMGAMPAFEGQLTEEQIQDVAAFVYTSTH